MPYNIEHVQVKILDGSEDYVYMASYKVHQFCRKKIYRKTSNKRLASNKSRSNRRRVYGDTQFEKCL